MKLTPLPTITEPDYPERASTMASWKKAAAVASAAAALWLPACGGEEAQPPCDVRTGGVAPQVENIRPPGTQQVTSPQDQGQEVKPPTLPEAGPIEARMPGEDQPAQLPPIKPPEVAVPTPPIDPTPTRTGGVARSPDPR